MEVFSRVAALGSLSAAARALSMSQTMATKHMAALEARLATRLLYRTTRRVSLTEAGVNYLRAIEPLLEQLAQADAEAARQAQHVEGHLRVSAPVSYGHRELAPLIPALSARHPNLTVELGLNDRHVNLVEEGWDLVIRIGTLADTTMIVRKLVDCPMHVCAAPAYLEKKGTPKTIADLQHHNCLGYTLSRTAGSKTWSFGAKGKTSVKISGTLLANNGDVLVTAAIAGEGIIYQPEFLVREALQNGSLIPLQFEQPPLNLNGVFAGYPADRNPPAKVRATIDFLVDSLARRERSKKRG
ncbi:MAG: LysR family transcriptional regulator [Pseudomonadota bacterium]